VKGGTLKGIEQVTDPVKRDSVDAQAVRRDGAQTGRSSRGGAAPREALLLYQGVQPMLGRQIASSLGTRTVWNGRFSADSSAQARTDTEQWAMEDKLRLLTGACYSQRRYEASTREA